MTLEQAIEAVHVAGYHVRNLFERQGGGWQANIGTLNGKTYSEFGIADTPAGALLEALRGAPSLERETSPADTIAVRAAVQGTLGPLTALVTKRPSLFD